MKGKHDQKMNRIPLNFKRIWIMCLFLLLAINMALALSSGSMSSFSRSFSGELQLNAGTGEDIISGFSILSGDNNILSALEQENKISNPVSIEIEKADGLTYYPVVYFTVEGEAADYVRHINPLVMDSKTKQAPVEVNFNLQKYIQLVNGKSVVGGTINIRCLNGGFVNETKEIEFTRTFLVNQYCRELGISEDKADTLPDVLVLLAGQKSWSQAVVDSSGNLQMTDEQRTIVDEVAPGLIAGSSGQIADSDKLISELTAKVDELNGQIKDLNDNIERLDGLISARDSEIAELKSTIESLNNKLAEYEKQIADLQAEIQSLKPAPDQEQPVGTPDVQ